MQRATKIVATLGPASSTPETVNALVLAGVNLFRLNFSHGTQDEQAQRVAWIRQTEKDTARPLGIIADLQGPKYRIGTLSQPLELKAGDEVCFCLEASEPKAGASLPRIELPHADIFASLQPGAVILIDDGRLRFTVLRLAAGSITCRCENAGRLTSQKGVNLPDVKLDITPLTKKDLSDLDFALEQGVDFIALSFVQQTSDILATRAIIRDRAQIIAKIEKPSALSEIDGIIAAADAVMVARGDLGVELPAQKVPAIQKHLIASCRQVGKPVIVATQMLESMISAPAPTRAEASDVAGAVFDGADAVMLSAETAAGSYPVEAVRMMAAIATEAEDHIRLHPHDGPARLAVEPSVYHAVAEAAVRLAEVIEAAAIIAFTASGNTAVRLARERPRRQLLVLTPYREVERKLTLLWGVTTTLQAESGYERAVDDAINQVRQKQLGNSGEPLVIVSGMPFGLSGTTNALRVATV